MQALSICGVPRNPSSDEKKSLATKHISEAHEAPRKQTRRTLKRNDHQSSIMTAIKDPLYRYVLITTLQGMAPQGVRQ